MAEISAFLNVHDIERSLAFYEGLGFEELERTEEDGKLQYVDLELDGAVLGLGAIESNEDPDFQQWVSGPLGGGVILYVVVDDVDAAFERAQQVGAKVEFEPHDAPYGRLFMLNDPDGYAISFIQT